MPTGSPKPSASVPQKQDWQVNNGTLIMPFPAGTRRELPRDKIGVRLGRGDGEILGPQHVPRRSPPLSFPDQYAFFP